MEVFLNRDHTLQTRMTTFLRQDVFFVLALHSIHSRELLDGDVIVVLLLLHINNTAKSI